MELRHLRYFTVVAELENITRAAVQLNVSQPPLSRQIRDLEREIGVSLFERSARRLMLTTSGRIFLREARRILKQTEQAVAKARDVAGRGRKEVHVGFAPSPSADLLPKALKRFQQQNRMVRVILHDMSSAEEIAGLTNRQLDLALIVRVISKPILKVRFEKLCEFSVGLLVPRNHPMARRKRVSLGDVRGQPLVGYSRREYPDYHRWISGVLAPARIRPMLTLECDGAHSLITAIKSGHGIAVAADVYQTLSAGSLVHVPFHPPARPLELGIATLKHRNMSPDAARFCEILREVASA